jgi:hypothetical protein
MLAAGCCALAAVHWLLFQTVMLIGAVIRPATTRTQASSLTNMAVLLTACAANIELPRDNHHTGPHLSCFSLLSLKAAKENKNL